MSRRTLLVGGEQLPDAEQRPASRRQHHRQPQPRPDGSRHRDVKDVRRCVVGRLGGFIAEHADAERTRLGPGGVLGV